MATLLGASSISPLQQTANDVQQTTIFPFAFTSTPPPPPPPPSSPSVPPYSSSPSFACTTCRGRGVVYRHSRKKWYTSQQQQQQHQQHHHSHDHHTTGDDNSSSSSPLLSVNPRVSKGRKLEVGDSVGVATQHNIHPDHGDEKRGNNNNNSNNENAVKDTGETYTRHVEGATTIVAAVEENDVKNAMKRNRSEEESRRIQTSSSSSSTTTSPVLQLELPANHTARQPTSSSFTTRMVTDQCSTCTGSGLLPLKNIIINNNNNSNSNSNSNNPSSSIFTTHESSSFPTVSTTTSSSSPTSRASNLHLLTHPQSPLIAISGCGIGGAAAALALRQRGMRCIVYERDTCFDARKQGYGLTMQQGAMVLAHLGIPFLAGGVSSTAHYSFDAQGNVLGCYGRALYSKLRKNTTTAKNVQEDEDVVANTLNENKNDTRRSSFHEKTKQVQEESASSTSSSSTKATITTTTTIGTHTGTGISSNQRERHNIHIPRQKLRSAILEQLLLTDAFLNNNVGGAGEVTKHSMTLSTPPNTEISSSATISPPSSSSVSPPPSNSCIRWGVSVLGYEEIEVRSEEEEEEKEEAEGNHDDNSRSSDSGGSGGMSTTTTTATVAKPKSQKRLRLRLSDGSTEIVHMLIAADGIHSILRVAKLGSSSSINSSSTGGGGALSLPSHTDGMFSSSLTTTTSLPSNAPTHIAIPSTPLSTMDNYNNSLRYLDVIVILGFAPCVHPLACGKIFQTSDGAVRLYTMPFSGPHGSNSNSSNSGSSSINSSTTTTTDHNTPSSTTTEEVDYTMWQLSFPMSETDAKALAARGGKGLKEKVLSLCGTWHTPIPELLHHTLEEDITGYPAYDRDIPNAHLLRYGRGTPLHDSSFFSSSSTGAGAMPTFPTTPTTSTVYTAETSPHTLVTLIGDAAHPMSPFKGQGANQALADAVALVRAIYDSDIGWRNTQRLLNRDDDGCTKQKKQREQVKASSQQQPYLSSSSSSSSSLPTLTTLQEALSSFEESMLARAGPKVLESRKNAFLLHEPSTALAVANCTRAHAAAVASGTVDAEHAKRLAKSALTQEEFEAAVEEVKILLTGSGASMH